MTSDPMPQPRRGFTAIELMVVLTIAIMLGTLTVGAVLPALRRGRVSQSVDAIGELSNDARRYARACTEPGRRYGLRLDGSATPNRVELLRDGEVIASKALSPIVQLYAGDQPLNGVREWSYQTGTGFPADPSDGRIRAVGAGARGSADHFSVRTLDQQVRTAFAIYAIGVLGTQEF